MRLLSAAVVAVMAGPAAAQADHFTTSPEGLDTTEGNSDSRDLLGTAPKLRYQQIDATNTRSLANLNRVAFRRDGYLPSNAAYGQRLIDLEIVMSESNLGAISTTFASNYTGNTAVVVSRKPVSVGDWTTRPLAPPAGQGTSIFFDQQWSYAGKAAGAGDLLWEVRVWGNDKAGQDYPFDFHYVVPNGTFGAKVPTRSTGIGLGRGCTVSGFTRSHDLAAMILNDGSRFAIDVTSFYGPPNAPTALLLDAIDRDLALPGLCSHLHAAALILPMGTSNATQGLAHLGIDPITHAPALVGSTLVLQAFAPDAGRGGAGVSMSAGRTIAIPPDPNDPRVGRIWAYDPTATTATVGPEPGGIVLWTNHP